MTLSFRRLVLAAALCAAIALAAVYNFAEGGLQHVEPAREWRTAGQAWGSGRRGAALTGYMRAWITAVDAGARWNVANIHIDQMKTEREADNLEQALVHCSRAVDILGSYDDEGGLSYECFTLETGLERQGSASPPQ